MAFLGIDYGDKKIGLAKSAESIVMPLFVIENNSNFLAQLSKICIDENIEKIIIGLPRSLSGHSNKTQEKIIDFAKYIKESIHMPIEFEDERFTSVLAKKAQKETPFDFPEDTLAAVFILQSHIDRTKKK